MRKILLICVLWVGARAFSIKHILFRRKIAFAVGIIGLLDVLVLWYGGCGMLDGCSVTSDNCFIKYCVDNTKEIVGLVKKVCYDDNNNVAAIWKKIISLFVWYGSLLFFVLRIQIGISQASVKISNWGVKTGLLMLAVLCLQNIYAESIILDFCFVITVLLFLVSVYGIFVRINPQNLFYHVLEQAFIERKVICLLVNREKKEILPEYFKDRLIHVTTSIYQCLAFIVERGMMNVYGGCSDKWHKEGLVFNEVDFRQFLEYSFDAALKYYKACLDGQVLLVKALYSKDYYEEGNSAIGKLLNLCPTWSFLKKKNYDVQKNIWLVWLKLL